MLKFLVSLLGLVPVVLSLGSWFGMRKSSVFSLRFRSCTQKAQGGTEYLVTMGAVLFVAMLAIGILLFAMGGTKDTKQSTLDIHAKIAAMEFPDLLQGLVAYWKFDEGSGTSAADNRGGNTGTLTNGPAWTTDAKSGKALQFDGTNDYVQVNDSNSLDLNASGTISFWAKVDAWQASYASLMQKGSNSGWCDNNYDPFTLFNHYTGGYIAFSICNTTAMNNVRITPRPSTGVWHYYAFTFDGSTLTSYLDGARNRTATQTVVMRTDSNPLTIGGNTFLYAFNGTIDEVMIFNRALSANEIRFLYENPGYPN